MKIGIITQPLQNNYGGILQNYALQEVIKRLNHTPITLDQESRAFAIKTIVISNLVTFVNNILNSKNKRKYIRNVKKTEREVINKNTQRFIDKYISYVKGLKTDDDYKNALRRNNIQTLIVGSDQVWRPLYCKKITRSYFDFAKGLDIKRIAYAASFGVDTWEYSKQETKNCKELIKAFNAVSVREESGIELCNVNLEKQATMVLDPTLLLEKEDYISIVENEKTEKSEGNLFAYILDPNQQNEALITSVSERLGLSPFKVMPKSNIMNDSTIENCIFPGVDKWLRAFMDAEFVVCDSFHGAVFSIIFNKPFIIYGNKERGMSRFNSLLKLFGLEDRLIDDNKKVKDIIDTPIDWDKINKIKKEWKDLSLKFLEKNI